MTRQIRTFFASIFTVEFLRIGKNELSRIGMGSWAFGGPWKYGYGRQEHSDSVAALERAVELGINWLDTAPIYGFGRAESLTGDFLQSHPNLFVSTKTGLYPIPDPKLPQEEWEIERNLDPSRLRSELEKSLERLNKPHIDYYMFHWPDPSRDALPAWRELIRFQEEGLIGSIGLSNFYLPDLLRLSGVKPPDFVQIPYSLVSRDYEREVLPWLSENSIPAMTYSPLFGGVLSGRSSRGVRGTGDWRTNHKYYSPPYEALYFVLLPAIERLALQYGVSMAAVSVAWILHRCAFCAVIYGGRSRSQVDDISVLPDLSIEDVESLDSLVRLHHPNSSRLFGE